MKPGICWRTGSAVRVGLGMAGGALLAAAAGPAASQAIDDKYWAEASIYFANINTTASVSRPDQPGTSIDMEHDLGLKKNEDLGDITVGARFWNRVVFVGEAYALDRNGSRTISRDLNFDGVTFPANATLESKFSSDVYRASVGYLFVRNTQVALGADIGIHATNFDEKLNGAANVGGGAGVQTERSGQDFLAPLPTIGVFGTYQPTPRVIFNGRVDWLSLKLGDYGGEIINAQASVGYRITRYFDLGAEYRYVKYKLDVDKSAYSARIDYDFSGPALFARLAFQ